MAVGDHLGTDQNVVFPVAERGQNGFVIVFAGDGIAIEARNASFRERTVQLVFDALRAQAQKLNVLAVAFGAALRDAFGIVAVVAQHAAVAPVISQRYRAVGALDPLSTRAASYETREP